MVRSKITELSMPLTHELQTLETKPVKIIIILEKQLEI